jgi:hypothetical protein
VNCSQAVAERYMQIASYKPYQRPQSPILEILPSSRTTLARLTALPPETFCQAVKSGKIFADMRFVDADALVRPEPKPEPVIDDDADEPETTQPAKTITVKVRDNPVRIVVPSVPEPPAQPPKQSRAAANFQELRRHSLGTWREKFEDLPAAERASVLREIGEDIAEFFPELERRSGPDDADIPQPWMHGVKGRA